MMHKGLIIGIMIGLIGGLLIGMEKPTLDTPQVVVSSGKPLAIENISLEIDRNYSENYKCLNFSMDLKKRLTDNNITSLVMIYKTPDMEGKHAVVAILVEPQTGELVPIQDYKYIRIWEEYYDNKTNECVLTLSGKRYPAANLTLI